MPLPAWGRLTLLAAALAASPAAAAAPTPPERDHAATASDARIPGSLAGEHHALHARLAAAVRLGGRTGAAARALEAVMMPHFREEERIAMPPLGLLVPLARGERPADAARVLAMTDELRRAWPRMQREHAEIARRLAALRSAAVAERRPEVVAFADALALHARTEEEILYPAALLVGDALRRPPGDGPR